MKHILITTIAAVVLVACASEPEYSGSYSLTVVEGTAVRFQLKSDGSFIGSPEGVNDDAVGTWKVEGDLLVCEGTTTKNSDQITVKFDKTTFMLISLAENGEEAPLDRMIPEGENGIYLRKSQQSAPAPEAKPEPPTAKAPDISIHAAAKAGHIEAVKQHLAAGTDVNAKNDRGVTPLIHAVGMGHKEVAELLIAEGADVNPEFFYGEAPLPLALMNGKWEIAEMLIAEGANVNARADYSARLLGYTPLQYAAMEGHKEIAQLLIFKGADVNAKVDFGEAETPLHKAASGGHKEIAQLLIAKGADVNAKNNIGGTPLDSAIASIASRSSELVDLLRNRGADSGAEHSIHIAAMTGNIIAVEKHLTDGVNANVKDINKMTPLHHAVSLGHREIAELLIAKGAEVNAKDKNGGTPLHIASSRGHKGIAELLITSDAEVNAMIFSGSYMAFYQGITPLDLAIGKNQTEIANLLRKHGGKTGAELKAEGK